MDYSTIAGLALLVGSGGWYFREPLKPALQGVPIVGRLLYGATAETSPERQEAIAALDVVIAHMKSPKGCAEGLKAAMAVGAHFYHLEPDSGGVK